VVVHSASIQDRDGAKLVIVKIRQIIPTLKIIWADQGYAGQLVVWVKRLTGIALKIVKRKAKSLRSRSFEPIPKRWIVERTFAWLCNYRRLNKNYEVPGRHRRDHQGKRMEFLVILRVEGRGLIS